MAKIKLEHIENMALPAGEYVLLCEKSEVKETNAKNGEYLNLKFVVAFGEHAGRPVWDIFTLKSQSSKAVGIGALKMRSIVRAMELDINDIDSDDFVGRTVVADIEMERGEPTRNRVMNYKAQRPFSKLA